MRYREKKKSMESNFYKQHYDLLTGQCMEDKDVVVRTYPVELVDGKVVIKE